MANKLGVAAWALMICVSAPYAYARDTISDQPVQAAVDAGKGKLLDVPFFMAGAEHGKVVDDLGVFTSNRSTNAFNKSEADACAIAFQSAIIALQGRATQLGGNAVIDIKSITKGQNLESATQFRCDDGTFAAKVTLSGRAVKLAK